MMREALGSVAGTLGRIVRLALGCTRELKLFVLENIRPVFDVTDFAIVSGQVAADRTLTAVGWAGAITVPTGEVWVVDAVSCKYVSGTWTIDAIGVARVSTAAEPTGVYSQAATATMLATTLPRFIMRAGDTVVVHVATFVGGGDVTIAVDRAVYYV